MSHLYPFPRRLVAHYSAPPAGPAAQRLLTLDATIFGEDIRLFRTMLAPYGLRVTTNVAALATRFRYRQDFDR